MPDICSMVAVGAIEDTIYPLIAIAAIVTSFFIAIGYMVGTAINNAKISLWARTEIIQLMVSLVVVIILFTMLGSFCGTDMKSVYSLFGYETDPAPCGSGSTVSVYCAAEHYLVDVGTWERDLVFTARYHLGAFNILQMTTQRKCGDVGGGVTNFLLCLFGSGLGGGAGGGVSLAPDSGYGIVSAGLGASFNSILFSYMSTLNFLFMLKYVYTGFPLFFLPLGMFLRSMPYVRTFGSLLMSIAISFLIMYPLVLAIFYIDVAPLPPAKSILLPYDNEAGEGPFVYVSRDAAGLPVENLDGKVGAWDAITGDARLYNDIFDKGEEQSVQIIAMAGNAFLAGVFIPTLAMMAAIASVAYVNRYLGEEMNFSRIMQMI